ncbi:hypothetical protein ACFLQU_04970 [Verrucomicrobiota bacterium]
MKIGLNMGESAPQVPKGGVSEAQILAAKKGDWTAKEQLANIFLPLLKSLAEKRAEEPSEINQFVDAGKEGLFAAARKYKPSIGADKFQVFALDYIQARMDRFAGGGGGFLSRLFGK